MQKNVFQLTFVMLFVGLVGCHSEGAKHKAAGNIYFREHQWREAEKEYRQALTINPKDAIAFTLLGNTFVEMGREADAEDAYRRAIKLQPTDRAALYGLATLALRKSDFTHASEWLSRVIAIEPQDAEAHAALGKIYFAQKQWPTAEVHLRHALVGMQNDAASLYLLSLAVFETGRSDEALQLLDRLNQFEPKAPYAPYGQALVFAGTGNADKSLVALSVAAERGFTSWDKVAAEPRFAAVVKLPAYQALATKNPPTRAK